MRGASSEDAQGAIASSGAGNAALVAALVDQRGPQGVGAEDEAWQGLLMRAGFGPSEAPASGATATGGGGPRWIGPDDRQPGGGPGSLVDSTHDWARNQAVAIPGYAAETPYACGPIAAEAMLRASRGDPNLDMAGELLVHARDHDPPLWNRGMAGTDEEKKLLADYGVETTQSDQITDFAAGTDMVRGGLERGLPVIISTRRHYFVASGIRDDGKLFVGQTGMMLTPWPGSSVSPSTHLTLQEIAELGKDEDGWANLRLLIGKGSPNVPAENAGPGAAKGDAAAGNGEGQPAPLNGGGQPAYGEA